MPQEEKFQGRGDVWTWTARDSETKLVTCWYIGNRDASAAYHFMHDLAERLASRVQLTTDGHKPYLQAVEDAFGADIDYAQLIKIYGNVVGPGTGNAQIRYSPAQCVDARKAVISGQPEYKHISISHTERQNLSMRTGMADSPGTPMPFQRSWKTWKPMSRYFMHYNFGKVHQTLRIIPAMEEGISDHVWTMTEIVALIDLNSN